MPHMPDKPDTWVIALAWLSQHSPTIYAATLSFVMAALRIIYGGGTRRQALLEATICMLLTTSLIAVLEYFGLPSSLATPAGIWIGFLGVKKIADMADRFADFKLPRRSDRWQAPLIFQSTQTSKRFRDPFLDWPTRRSTLRLLRR